MTMLSLSDVSRDFITRGKTIQAMAGVSLDVTAGEFLTVVGPSGCGRSTLLNIVCGLLAPNIIRTLMYDPEVILMDEPFGPLDAQTRLLLQDQLLKLWDGARKTIVFITHDLGEAVALADRRRGDDGAARHGQAHLPGTARAPARPLSPPRRALSPDLRHAVGRSRGRGQESARVRLRLLAWRLGFGLAVLVLWEAAAGRVIDPFWFSSPLRIARHLIEWVREGTLFGHLLVTLRETFLGFVLGSVAGIAVGVALSRLEFVARVLDPFIVAANGIPRVALAPLFIIWFGIGELSKIVLASTLTFFLTFYGTFSGLRAVEPAYQEIARVMGASERQIFFKVSLPAASPWIVSALKVGVPFSLIGAIIGEFMAASRGLGYMIQLSTNQFDTTAAVSGILVLMVCVMLFNGVLNRLERYVLRWRPRERTASARELQ